MVFHSLSSHELSVRATIFSQPQWHNVHGSHAQTQALVNGNHFTHILGGGLGPLSSWCLSGLPPNEQATAHLSPRRALRSSSPAMQKEPTQETKLANRIQ